jgi:hypothetical protein
VRVALLEPPKDDSEFSHETTPIGPAYERKSEPSLSASP